MKLSEIVARAGAYASALEAARAAQAAFEAARNIPRVADEVAGYLLRLAPPDDASREAMAAALEALKVLGVAGGNAAVPQQRELARAASTQNEIAAAVEADGIPRDILAVLVSIVADNSPASQNEARIKAYLDKTGFAYEV